jgi:hypothetical protein
VFRHGVDRVTADVDDVETVGFAPGLVDTVCVGRSDCDQLKPRQLLENPGRQRDLVDDRNRCARQPRDDVLRPCLLVLDELVLEARPLEADLGGDGGAIENAVLCMAGTCFSDDQQRLASGTIAAGAMPKCRSSRSAKAFHAAEYAARVRVRAYDRLGWRRKQPHMRDSEGNGRTRLLAKAGEQRSDVSCGEEEASDPAGDRGDSRRLAERPTCYARRTH